LSSYSVFIQIETEQDSAHQAACHVYKLLSEKLASPPRGHIMSRVMNNDSGESIDMPLFDGVIHTEPLLAAQIIGIRHLIWTQQNMPKKQ
jgi:hypothetical protein